MSKDPPQPKRWIPGTILGPDGRPVCSPQGKRLSFAEFEQVMDDLFGPAKLLKVSEPVYEHTIEPPQAKAQFWLAVRFGADGRPEQLLDVCASESDAYQFALEAPGDVLIGPSDGGLSLSIQPGEIVDMQIDKSNWRPTLDPKKHFAAKLTEQLKGELSDDD